MAKPKNPLLSLGARGSIADTLTFQKRGRLTIARQKPIPTDPKTDLQLAQRQVYREAIAAWNALTPEEKEAYRGVCPGLTPYQCYMKTALAAAPPTPPPEEQIEEQTDFNSSWGMFGATWCRVGQRLIIPNRKVTKLGFWLDKVNFPTGDIIFSIRRVSDDSPISTMILFDAALLNGVPTYYEVEFDDPQTIDQEVRILCEFYGGDASHKVNQNYQTPQVKDDELLTYYNGSNYAEQATSDIAYRYKYYEVD